MKRIAAVFALFALACLLCAGCMRPAAQKTVSMYDLSRAMLDALKTEETMRYVSASDAGAEEKFARVSDTDYADVEDFFLLYAENGAGNADEIAVIAVKHERDASAAADSLRAHVEYRTQLYATYDPAQVPKLNGALVFTEGKYAVLIVCDEPTDVKTAFYAFLAEGTE